MLFSFNSISLLSLLREKKDYQLNKDLKAIPRNILPTKYWGMWKPEKETKIWQSQTDRSLFTVQTAGSKQSCPFQQTTKLASIFSAITSQKISNKKKIGYECKRDYSVRQTHYFEISQKHFTDVHKENDVSKSPKLHFEVLSAILGFLIHVPPTISIPNWLSFQANMGILQSDEVGVKISSIQLCGTQSAGDIRESHVSWQCVHEAEQAVCSFTALKPLQCWKMQLRGDKNKLLYEAIFCCIAWNWLRHKSAAQRQSQNIYGKKR